SLSLENVIRVASGTYAGTGNRGLDFGGYDIRLESVSGAGETVVDLEGSGPFLTLNSGETSRSLLDGFTLRNIRNISSLIVMDKTALVIRNCVISDVKIFAENEMWYYWEPGGAALLRMTDATLDLSNTSISNCLVRSGCNLLYASGSHLTLNRVCIDGNDTGYNDILHLDNSSLAMVNCSIHRNNTRSAGGVIRSYGETYCLSAVNCTFAFNTNGVTPAFSISGTFALLNSIVMEKISGGVGTMDFCCTAIDCSDLGTGNFVADPKLSLGGFLYPDSPCVDAGRLAGAPDIDIIGTARPTGTGIDIGCEEFADTDADGLSDYYEATYGSTVSPASDPDGDGLTILEEYQLGTDGFNPDSDGDGMPDGWEVTYSLDPLWNDACEDPDGDLLLNIEEFEAGSNPNVADSDGDGRNDYWEVKEAFSNPSVVDFDGVETLLATLSGNAFTNSGGGWDADGSVACARNRAGWIEYSFTVATPAVYQIELEVEQLAINASTDVFIIACHVDGAFSSSKRIGVNANGIGAGRYFTPRLSAGTHTITFVWSNVYRNTILQINAIRLYALSGADADADGVPDWINTRLDNMSEVELPETSLTSPVCVEGGNAAFIEQMSISGFYTPAGQTPVPPEIRNHSFNRWHADLPLNPDGATPVSVSIAYQNGAVSVSENITWTPADLAQLEYVTIRKNDSLLLTAILPDSYTGDFTISVEGTDHELEHGDILPWQFETTGIVSVVVSWTPPGGSLQSLETLVTVKEAFFNGDPICYVNAERQWVNAGLAEDTFVEADRGITVMDLGMQGENRVFSLKSRMPAEGYVTARLFAGGPILDVARMVVIEATSHVNDGYHRVITDFGDGTVLYDGYLVVDQVVPGMSVYVSLWGTNTVFEDGPREKWFTSENFDSSGELHFNIIGGTGFTTCQSIELWQDGILVWKLQ
ncbi:MAG: choice-of-anchor Q domain-containing protein, partial [Sphaerochaetaceae bacterium]